jgi:hypothetical protein
LLLIGIIIRFSQIIASEYALILVIEKYNLSS